MYKFEEPLARLALLMANGKSKSPEAFDLREELAELDYKLSPEDKELMDGLSSDLYQLEGVEILEGFECLDKSVLDDCILDALACKHTKEGLIKALGLLRSYMDITDIGRAFHRSLIYEKLGMPLAAKAFRDYYKKLEDS